jgi:hypothetical protein
MVATIFLFLHFNNDNNKKTKIFKNKLEAALIYP